MNDVIKFDPNSIVDILNTYNSTFGFTIRFNDEYYMYGDASTSEEIYIGKLSTLFNVITDYFAADVNGDDIYDEGVFGDIVDDAVEDAADVTLSEEEAFRNAVALLQSKYGFKK